jgi:hypothetical protein
MKIVLAVFADFVTAPAGGPSQLGTRLGDRTVLAHTLTRVGRVGVDARYLVVNPRDAAIARAALDAQPALPPIELLPIDTVPRQRRALLTTARKWNLDSWRGGLVGATWFDEYLEPASAALVIRHAHADAILCLDGHQPLLDPELANAMLRHAQEHRDDARMVFTQAPPGISGIVLRQSTLVDLLEYDIPLGLLLTYRPELAQPDPIISANCYGLPVEIAQTAARLTADTRRSRELLAGVLEELGLDVNAGAVCRWLTAPGHDRAGALPVEVELELTTADPLPQTALRPRGSRVPQRELTELAAIERLAAELATYDDRLVVLGGHGDPLSYPKFAEVCRIFRAAGVCGLAVVTPLVNLPDAALEALLTCPVDVVEVQIDAADAQTYLQVHKLDAFDRVQENLGRIAAARRDQQRPRPIPLCSMTRCEATLPTLEEFYDQRVREFGSAVLRGFNDYSGALPGDSLLSTSPFVREACRRLDARLMLLADGTVAQCSQDLRGAHPLGNWSQTPLSQIWAGAALADLREAHHCHALQDRPLCAACSEWNRP